MVMRTLALPGDEADVLAWLIGEARRRDDRLTYNEAIAKDYGQRCAKFNARIERHGGSRRCIEGEPCHFCQGVSLL